MKELKLIETEVFTVKASADDRTTGYYGLYSTYNAAAINTKGAGWYGSDGEVVQKPDMYTDGVNVYEVKCLGEFTDKKVEKLEEMLSNIKAKLTPEEWEFYNSNIKK